MAIVSVAIVLSFHLKSKPSSLGIDALDHILLSTANTLKRNALHCRSG
jgi:hypothetical protein